MKGLGPGEISEYLAVLAGLGSSCRLYDTHVHPYEVLFDRFTYDSESPITGVSNLSGRCYTAPSVRQFSFPEAADFNDDERSQRLQDISVMLLGKVYGSVGERVFLDQMNLCGIGKVLLLPIAPDSGEISRFDSRMGWVKKFYANEDRFWIAGSIPAALSGREIGPYARTLRKEYGIRALKCHPVVSGIDLGRNERKEWLEMMLVACQELGLPLVIHGGRNNAYWGGARGNFGSLGHLSEINFSRSSEPVVIAHAGFHRCGIREIKEEGLPMLAKVLQRHANVYVDISGLGFEPLKLVLQSVDRGRILFGSDALYSPQWEAVTMTMHALKVLGMKVEESFVQFASINPENTIFRGDKPC